MNKLSETDWIDQKTALESKPINKDRDERREFHISIGHLASNSPFENETTSQLISQLRSTSNAIWETLMREGIDIEKDRGIPLGWILRKEMAHEGHKTVIYRNPADGKKYLFWEGDGTGSERELKEGKFVPIQSPGLDPDGSILVEFKSVMHKELREKITMFRRTSIAWDDTEDDNNGDDFVEPMIPTGPNAVELLA